MRYRALVVFLLASLTGLAASRADDDKPWEADLALVQEGTQPDRLLIIVRETYVTRFEAALARGRTAAEDGLRLAARTNGHFSDPYPVIGMALATYYDKAGKTDDALRVVEMSLDIMSLPHSSNAEKILAMLDGERGALRIERGDWKGALADFDNALTHADSLPQQHHAWLLRGRGYALIKLGRIVDAGRPVTDSLILQPENALGLIESALLAPPRKGKKPPPPLPPSIGFPEPTIMTIKPGDNATNAVAIQMAPPALPPAPPQPIITPPKVVGRTHDCTAFYPAESARLNETGKVIIRYDVAIDGAIGNVGIDKSSGFPRLDQAALDCVSKQWKDTPALQGDTPVASPGHRAVILFHFTVPQSPASP